MNADRESEVLANPDLVEELRRDVQAAKAGPLHDLEDVLDGGPFINFGATIHDDHLYLTAYNRTTSEYLYDDAERAALVKLLRVIERRQPGILAEAQAEYATGKTVSDGFGGEWLKCDRTDCGLEVVRPGKVQCSECDGS